MSVSIPPVTGTPGLPPAPSVGGRKEGGTPSEDAFLQLLATLAGIGVPGASVNLPLQSVPAAGDGSANAEGIGEAPVSFLLPDALPVTLTPEQAATLQRLGLSLEAPGQAPEPEIPTPTKSAPGEQTPDQVMATGESPVAIQIEAAVVPSPSAGVTRQELVEPEAVDPLRPEAQPQQALVKAAPADPAAAQAAPVPALSPLLQRVDQAVRSSLAAAPAEGEGDPEALTANRDEISPDPAEPLDLLQKLPPAQVEQTEAAPEVKQAEPLPGLRQTGPLEPAQVMDLVSRAVAQARPGRYSVSLRLHPENLGEVRLEVILTGREVHAAMEVTSAAAKQALENQGQQLREGLNQSGLALAGFQVSTGGGGQSPQDRRDAFAAMLSGERRSAATSAVSTEPPSTVTPKRGVPLGRTGSRLDTLA